MPAELRKITRDDIMPMDDYVAIRKERKAAMMAVKRNRRLSLGPHATLYFENFDTMWMQIQEMLYIERGGDTQIDDEIAAYNNLIPNGRELVVTLMFEISNEVRRDIFLSELGGVEDTISLTIGDDVVMAVPEDDLERTNSAGKTSSIHFLHFPLSDEQAEALRNDDISAVFGISHEKYPHMVAVPKNVRDELVRDLS